MATINLFGHFLKDTDDGVWSTPIDSPFGEGEDWLMFAIEVEEESGSVMGRTAEGRRLLACLRDMDPAFRTPKVIKKVVGLDLIVGLMPPMAAL